MPPELLAAVTADVVLALIYVRKSISRFAKIPTGGGTYSVGIALTSLTFVADGLSLTLSLLETRKKAPTQAPAPPPSPTAN